VTRTGGDEAKALNFTTKVFKTLPYYPEMLVSLAMYFFKQGQGDVIQLQNEGILAGLNGETALCTDVNISIDNPVAVIE